MKTKWKDCASVHRGQLFLIFLIGFTGGCYNGHSIVWSPNTDPSSVSIYEDDTNTNHGSRWKHILTEEDKKRGVVDLPDLTIRKEGYLPYQIPGKEGYFKIDRDFYSNYNVHGFTSWQGTRVHQYETNELLRLKRNPGYKGPKHKNTVEVIINSEPRGASIYEDGKYIGKTPYTLHYTIRNNAYERGRMHPTSLTVVLSGYAPQEVRPEIKIKSGWRYQSGRTFDAESGIIIVLKRDGSEPYSTGGPTGHDSAECDRKSREYEVAEREHEDAVSALESAERSDSLGEAIWSFNKHSAPGKNKGLAFLNKTFGDVDKANAEKNVRIAKESLETARSRLCR